METVKIILRLLEEQHKNQKELTEFLHIPEASFSDWKRGKTKSYKKYIDKIAEFFGVSTDYLLNTDSVNNSNPDSNFFGNPIVSQAYNNLKERDKLAVQMYILETAEKAGDI